MKNYLKGSKTITKKNFIDLFLGLIKEKKTDSLDIFITIGNARRNDIYIKDKELNFDLDYQKDILERIDLSFYRVSLKFENIIFKGKVSFKEITLKSLEFKDVTFKENVGIKNLFIETLILRPYRIDAHIVVNIGSHAINGVVLSSGKYKIDKIFFEDPHICNGKIYFIGINRSTSADFTNRNLENVIFQNCNFENTSFLNSFLKESKFLNCEFPLVRNEGKKLFLGWESFLLITLYILTIIILFIRFFTVILNDSLYIEYINIYLFFTLPFLFIVILYILFYGLDNILSRFNTLIGNHYGIKDEVNILEHIIKICNCKKNTKEYNQLYRQTLSNIESIYTDLKINFKNNGDEQKAGDFYYASSLSKIVLSKRFIDSIILMGSYIINGFGERPLRSFYSVVIILIFLSVYQTPNINYIATSATPMFLLKAEKNIKNNITILDINESFQKYMIINDTNNKGIYSFDLHFRKLDKNIKEYYIPKLQESLITRMYYATSHIVAPFMQESRKWFQNIGTISYEISIVTSLLLWLFLVGMMKAVFNRIKR